MSTSSSGEKSDNIMSKLTDRFFDSAATGKVDEVKSLLNGA